MPSKKYLVERFDMKKIIVRVSQGLANRMFQLAYAFSLKEKGYDVEIDYMRNNKFAHEAIEVGDIFNIELKEAEIEEIKRLRGNDCIINKIMRHLPLFSSCRIIPFSEPYRNEYSEYRKDTYVIGTFQSQNFFENIADYIKHIYTFPLLVDNRNLELASKMAQENSVAIHVRKGFDYQKDILHNTCQIEYYQKAISYMKENVENPVFYIFTDNPKWVKANIGDCKYTLVDWNPTTGKSNYLDMQMMSLAKHNIIANSTYSWWSAWLNSNIDKIVVAPANWYNPQYNKLKNVDIVPNEWVRF